jgi:nicotinate phosphoribosyltransferase
LKGKPLIKACMRQGERCRPAVSLGEIREHAAQELNSLPEPFRSLKHDFSYPVEISDSLKKLAESLAKKLK